MSRGRGVSVGRINFPQRNTGCYFFSRFWIVTWRWFHVLLKVLRTPNSFRQHHIKVVVILFLVELIKMLSSANRLASATCCATSALGHGLHGLSFWSWLPSVDAIAIFLGGKALRMEFDQWAYFGMSDVSLLICRVWRCQLRFAECDLATRMSHPTYWDIDMRSQFSRCPAGFEDMPKERPLSLWTNDQKTRDVLGLRQTPLHVPCVRHRFESCEFIAVQNSLDTKIDHHPILALPPTILHIGSGIGTNTSSNHWDSGMNYVLPCFQGSAISRGGTCI